MNSCAALALAQRPCYNLPGSERSVHSTGALLRLALLHVLLQLYRSRSPPSTLALPLALHSRPAILLRWLVHQSLHMTHSAILMSRGAEPPFSHPLPACAPAAAQQPLRPPPLKAVHRKGRSPPPRGLCIGCLLVLIHHRGVHEMAPPSVLLCRHVHQPLHIVPPPPPCRLDQPHQLQFRGGLQGKGGWSWKVRY